MTRTFTLLHYETSDFPCSFVAYSCLSFSLVQARWIVSATVAPSCCSHILHIPIRIIPSDIHPLSYLAPLLSNSNGAKAPQGSAQQGTTASPDCKPSTLTWKTRFVNYTIPYESFALTIRGAYEGAIPMQSPDVGKVFSSPDNKFSVLYGKITTELRPLTLTWGGQRLYFEQYNEKRSNLSVNEYLFEFDYWACIVA